MRRRGVRWALWAVAAAAGAVLIWAVAAYRVDRPVAYDDIVEHYKYGSIGSEPGVSLLRPVGGTLPPYWIFRALPSICPEKLPGGFASVGLIVEPGRDLPVGISRRRRIGVDHVGLNCAVCHTGTVRDSPEAPPRIIPGMPSHQLDLQAFVEFVLECSLDNRLTAANIRGRFPEDGGPAAMERLLFAVGAFGVVDRLKSQTLELRNRMAPLLGAEAPRWGRGRVDTFNPYKAIQFNWPIHELSVEERTGASDFPSLWNQRPREGMQLHWDGDNDSVDERNLSAGLGAGITPVTVDHGGIKRVRDWTWTLSPPPYPYPVDAVLAQQGAAAYAEACGSCHGDHQFRDGVVNGDRVGTVVPIAEIGTDPYRLNSYTEAFAANQYGLFPDSPYRFTRFRKTYGYANHPLDGIWARAPYLHNGSVPTLRDLLEPPARRPAVFYRGYDVYDQVNVGFLTDVPEEKGRRYTRYDTSVPGNSNAGHVYGTTLSDAEKRAIVEYMKTF